MKPPNRPAPSPKLTSIDVLEALGLQRRRSVSFDVALAVGIATAGALLGAGAVLLRAGVVSLRTPKPAAATS